MIANNLQKMIGEAMKAKDEVRLSTLRLLSSAFNYERIEKQHELTDEEEVVVIRHQAKERKEAIEALRQAQGKPTPSGTNQDERIKKEEKELVILQELLPPEMTDEELSKLVDNALAETKAVGMADIGRAIGAVMAKAKGQADGAKVSELVRNKLS